MYYKYIIGIQLIFIQKNKNLNNFGNNKDKKKIICYNNIKIYQNNIFKK